MKVYTANSEKVFFSGDIHGNFKQIGAEISNHSLNDCSIVICGDIGIGFEKEDYYTQVFNHITKKLKKNNVHLYMFRGNHDSKDFFDGEHFTEFEYIHVIPDYSVIKTPSSNILCVGGAISIDRKYRKQKTDMFAIDYMKHHGCGWDKAYENVTKLYWENEPPVYDETELQKLGELGITIDTVCTHTAPSICQPLTKDGIKGWIEVDSKLDYDLNNERDVCDKLLKWLSDNGHKVDKWYYGHFHFSNTEYINGIKFTLLDMAREKMNIA